MVLKTTAIAIQWLCSDHMVIPTAAKATMDTATEERYFLCSPCRNVISRTVRAMSEFVRQLPAAKNRSTEAEDIVGIREQATTGEEKI
jgi:hypothetical protein